MSEPKYTATKFALEDNQKAERKLLVTCVNLGDSIAKSGGTPKWVPIGVGVEDSSIEFSPETEKKTDIFGTTETTINKLELSQSMEPLTIRGGNPFLFDLNDKIERNALSEFALYELMIIRAFVKDGESDGGYHAEVHKNCTVIPQRQGGSSYVDMPVNIEYSNDKTLGTVNTYKPTADKEIVFTPIS